MFKEHKYDDLKMAHKAFYDKDFEIMPMYRISYYHFFPITILEFLAELMGQDSVIQFGQWKGLISTDGDKIVITRIKKGLKAYLLEDITKVGKTFEFKADDIISKKFISFKHDPKVTLNLNKKIKGLSIPGVSTLTKIITLIIQVGFMWTIILFFLPNFYKKPQIKIRLDDKYKNKEKFKSLL